MKFLSIFSINLLISTQFVDRFNEGGTFFMSLILICLLLAIFLLIRGFLNIKTKPEYSKKMLGLVGDVSLLGLVLGFFGSIIGLISAFDAFEGLGEVNSGILAGGLKVSFLTTLFGSFVFIISRIGMLILRTVLKETKA